MDSKDVKDCKLEIVVRKKQQKGGGCENEDVLEFLKIP
jgi:hypothetical protein